MPARSLKQYESFAASGSGSIKDLSIEPGRLYSLQVKGHSAAASAWNVELQVSNDGVNFTQIATHVSGSQADGLTVFAVDKPACFARAVCNSVTLGSAGSLDVNWLAVP